MPVCYEITDRDALILVDVQVDFCPGGALAVPGGDAVVPVLNALAPRFRHVVATGDQHPANHCSFRAQGGPWPVHCVAGTPGAAYHPDLKLQPVTLEVCKATTPEAESYSGFGGRPILAEALRELGVERLFVGGLATDYCVLNTVLDACRERFETTALTDAMRAVDLQPGDGQRALEQMRAAGARLAESRQIAG